MSKNLSLIFILAIALAASGAAIADIPVGKTTRTVKVKTPAMNYTGIRRAIKVTTPAVKMTGLKNPIVIKANKIEFTGNQAG